MVGEVGSGDSSVLFCVDCHTRFKLRTTPHGPEVAWIILDRSVYENRDLMTVYPSLSRTQEDLRCPVCGTDCLKRLQTPVREAPGLLLREAVPPTP